MITREQKRDLDLTSLTTFVMENSYVTAQWGRTLVHDYLGWFYDSGLIFVLGLPNGPHAALVCIRVVRDPLEACENNYVWHPDGEYVFVDFALTIPGTDGLAMRRLWTFVHGLVMDRSPNVKYVSWLRHNSPKPIFIYPVARMHARLKEEHHA